MGFFKDAFSHGDKKEFLLNYDDAAFNYFIFVILLCILIPIIYMIIKRIIWRLCGWEGIPMNFHCTCQECEKTKDRYKKTLKGGWLSCGLVVEVRSDPFTGGRLSSRSRSPSRSAGWL